MNKTTDIKTYRKEYYKAHREHILKSVSQIIKCDVCNCNIQKQWKSKHKKTKKHIKNLNKKNAIFKKINTDEPYFVTPIDKAEAKIPESELINLK